MRLGSRTAAALLVVGATWFVNAPTLEYGFVYDDHALLIERPPVGEQGWDELFASRQWGAGRQFVLLSYDLQRGGSPNPRAFHVVNVWLACAVALLVHALALDLGFGAGAALTATLFFTLQPTHVDAVVSIAGRAELLAALAVLVCLLLHRHGYPPRGSGVVVAGLCFVLGLASKESAVVLLPLLLLNDTLLPASDRRAAIRPYVLYAGLLVAWLVLSRANLGTLAPVTYVDNPLADRAFIERIPLASEVLWRYLALVVWPFGLLPDRSFAQTDPQMAAGVLALLGWVGVAVFAWLLHRRWPRAVFAWLWFPAAFAVTANVAFPIGSIMAERLLFLPSVGPCMLAGLVVTSASRWGRLMRTLTVAVTILAMTVCAFLYDARARVWASEEHYHSTAAIDASRSAKAHYNLGLLRARQGRDREARVSFRRALDIYPAFSSAAYYLAGLWSEQGRLARAAAVYRTYLRERPADTGALSQLVAIQWRRDRLIQTRRLVHRLLELEPTNDAHLETLRRLDGEAQAVSP